jgi:hypothetical protein
MMWDARVVLPQPAGAINQSKSGLVLSRKETYFAFLRTQSPDCLERFNTWEMKYFWSMAHRLIKQASVLSGSEEALVLES